MLWASPAHAVPPAFFQVYLLSDAPGSAAAGKYLTCLREARIDADIPWQELPFSLVDRTGPVGLKLGVGQAHAMVLALCDCDMGGHPMSVLKTWGPYEDLDAHAQADIMDLMRQALNLTGHHHPWFGLSVTHQRDGLRVNEVALGSQPMLAGLHPDDVLASVQNRPVPTRHDLEAEIARHRMGESVTLGIVRKGQPTSVTVVLDRGDLLPQSFDTDDVHGRDYYQRAVQELARFGIVPPACTYVFETTAQIGAGGRYAHHHVQISLGLGRAATVALMAHELTHGWQFDTLPHQSKALVEGFATWVQCSVLDDLDRHDMAQGFVRNTNDTTHTPGLVWLLKLERRQGRAAVLTYGRTAAGIAELDGVATPTFDDFSDAEPRGYHINKAEPTPTSTAPPGY